MAIREVLELVIKGDAKGAIEAFRGTSDAADKAEGSVSRSGAMFEKLTGRFPVLGKAAEKFGVDAGNAGTVAGTAATAAAAAVGAFAAKSVEAYQNVAGEILKFQRASGASAEEASKFVEVAGDYGISADQAAGSVGKLAKAVATTPGAFREYGIEIAKNADGTTDLVGTLVNAAGAFDRIQDPAKRAEMGTKLFGKSWQDMLPLLEKGSEGLRESFEGVSKLKILNEKDLKQAEEFRLAMDDLKDAGEGLMIQVGRGLVPVISDLATELGKVTAQADKLTKPIGGLGKAVGGLATSFKDGGFFAGGFKTALQGASEKAKEAEEAENKLADATRYAGSQADLYVQSLVQRNAVGEKQVEAAEATAAAEMDYAEVLKLTKELADDAAKNQQEYADSIDEVWRSTQSALDPTFAYHNALREVADGADDVSEKAKAAADATKKHGADSKEAAKANRELQGAQEKLARDIQVASLRLLEQNGTVAGSKEAYDTQIKAIQELRATYGTELGPVGAMIDDLELRLRRAAQQAANLTANARIIGSGGAGYAPRGTANSFGQVSEGASFAPAMASAAPVTINVSSLDPAQAGRLVVDAIANYERTNGTGWRS